MKILHLTDFHFSGRDSYIYDQDVMVREILGSTNIEKAGIDFLIFSGDLVYEGKSLDEFGRADELLLTKIADYFSISRDRVIICPGNHDVNWNASSRAVENYIQGFKTNAEVDHFVSKNDTDYVKSLEILENFYEYRQLFYAPEWEKSNDIVDKQYTVHIRVLSGGRRIGIVTLNSAWRSINYDRSKFSDGESGQLLIPVIKLKQALGQLGEVDFKVCVVHHPLNFLRKFNEWEVYDIIQREFNLLLTGHTHRSSNSVNYHDKGGIVAIGSPAVLADKTSELGINLLTIDLNASKIRLESRRFDHFAGKFNGVTFQKDIKLPLPKDKERMSKIRRMVRSRLDKEHDEANSLFLSSFGDSRERQFGSLFTPPVLSHAGEYFEDVGNLSRPPKPNVDYKEIIENASDCLILGGDKSGKSSLLKKIQLEFLEGFEAIGHLPYLIDCNEINKSRRSRDLHKGLRNYFNLSDKDIKQVTNDGNIVLLIDNFDSDELSFAGESIRQFLKIHKKTVLIGAFSTTRILDLGKITAFGKDMVKYFIHSIRKREIRQLVNKWPNINHESKDEIVEKIFKLTKQMAIPFNYWSVSLFLWVFETTSDSNPRSDVQLIELYIERLLNKEEILLDKTKAFGFDKYKKFLASLAHKMLKNHEESNYSIVRSELLRFAEDYVAQNPRNVVDPSSVIEYVLDKGILKSRENGTITFRLRGVFEYFLAYQLQLDVHFREEVLASPSSAAPFRNELEYYAGFATGDSKFMARILALAKEVFSDSISKRLVGFSDFDEVLKSVYSEADYRKLAKALGSPIRNITQDDIEVLSEEVFSDVEDVSPLAPMDGAGIKLKRQIELDEYSLLETRETFLMLICRVFRNQDEVGDSKLLNEVLDFVLEAGIAYGFITHDELVYEFSEKEQLKGAEVSIVDWIAKMIPFLVTTVLFDGMGHVSIEKLLQRKIEELLKSSSGNQYKIFILLMLQIDLSPSRSQEKIDQLIGYLGMGAIKASLLMKLQFYLIMRNNGNQQFIEFLSSRIRNLAKSINPLADTNRIAETHRLLLLAERNKEGKVED